MSGEPVQSEQRGLLVYLGGAFGMAWLRWLPLVLGARQDGIAARDVDDDDFVVLLTEPHVLANVVIRRRVLAAFELHHGHALAHAARDAERGGERFRWQWVQPLPLLDQPFDRRAARRAMRSSIRAFCERVPAPRSSAGTLAAAWGRRFRNAQGWPRQVAGGKDELKRGV